MCVSCVFPGKSARERAASNKSATLQEHSADGNKESDAISDGPRAAANYRKCEIVRSFTIH